MDCCDERGYPSSPYKKKRNCSEYSSEDDKSRDMSFLGWQNESLCLPEPVNDPDYIKMKNMTLEKMVLTKHSRNTHSRQIKLKEMNKKALRLAKF